MGKRLIITEEEKNIIKGYYGLNNYLQIESHFIKENNNIEDKIKISYDDEPEKFVDNIITNVPQLKPIKQDLENKITSLSNFGGKSVIIGLISLVSTFTSCVQSGNDNKFCKTKIESEKENFPFDFGSFGAGVEKFYKDFLTKYPDWNTNDIIKKETTKKTVQDFVNFVNNGGLNQTPLEVKSVNEVNGKGVVHLVFGVSINSKLPIHFDIFGVLPLKDAIKIKQDSYTFFNFKFIKPTNVQPYENEISDLFYSSFPNIYDFNVGDAIMSGKHITKEYPDISLGLFKAQLELDKTKNIIQ
jgi:hypothetical protein